MVNYDFGRNSLTQVFKSLPNVNRSTKTLSQSTDDVNRYQRYVDFWRLYLGEHWDYDRKDNEKNLTVNFCAKFVDKIAIFLMGEGWNLVDPDSGYSQVVEPFLDEFWKYNKKELWSMEMAQMGGITGDCFSLTLPTADFQIKTTPIPPMYVTPHFSPFDKDRILSAKIEYPLYTNDNTTPSLMSIIVDENKVSYYINGEASTEFYHGIGECPLAFVRNRPLAGAMYGVSDLAHIKEIQKNFNEKLTDISDIINYHAAPTTLGYGVRLTQIQKGAKKMYANLPTDSKIENLKLDDDLMAATKHLQYMENLLHVLSDVPKVALANFDNLKISNTSALAIQLMFQPLLDVTKIKRSTYGHGIRTVNRHALKFGVNMGILIPPVGQRELNKFYDTEVDFRDPLPRDELIKLNMIITRMNNGLMHVKDALEALGETNVMEYIKQIEEDIEAGRIISLRGSFSNMGGILRNNMTNEQIDRHTERQSKESEQEIEREDEDAQHE